MSKFIGTQTAFTTNAPNMHFDEITLIASELEKPVQYPVKLNANFFSEDEWICEAENPFGTVIYCETQGGDFTFLQSHYYLIRPAKVSIQVKKEFLALNFALKSNINYAIEGHFKGTLNRYQYNLIYLPKTLCEYSFERGHYATFCVYFSVRYLKQFCGEYFPALKDFLVRIESKAPAMISHLSASDQMVAVIKCLIENKYTGVIRKMYMEAKAGELTLLALEQITARHGTNGALKQTDILKIQEAKDYLIKHLNTSCSVDLLAHKVGLNKRKLANGFKGLFGKTVYSFFIDERLKKAVALIRDTNMPLTNIADQLGYKHLSGFTKVFTRKFGYPPGQLRSNSMEADQY